MSDLSKSPKELHRRDFLALATRGLLALSGLIGLGGLVRYFSFKPISATPTHIDAGPASDYPPGSRTVLPEASAVIIHDAAGISALSLICPHLGCTVEVTSDGFSCPCHGSRFDPDGLVVRGPARDALAPMGIEISQDERVVIKVR